MPEENRYDFGRAGVFSTIFTYRMVWWQRLAMRRVNFFSTCLSRTALALTRARPMSTVTVVVD
jgi:hypothetical protein